MRHSSHKKTPFHIFEIYGIQPKVIFDVGANKGLTIDLFKQYFWNSKIYAFEAIPKLGAELEKKYLDNSGIIIVPNALDKGKGHSIKLWLVETVLFLTYRAIKNKALIIVMLRKLIRKLRLNV